MDALGATEASGDDHDRERERAQFVTEHQDRSHDSDSVNNHWGDVGQNDSEHEGREEAVQEESDNEEVKEDEEDGDEDEEPHLKYVYLTRHMPSIYRGGDATSSFIAAGDKLVCRLSSPGCNETWPNISVLDSWDT
jgi:vacuolar protein sorting-associated protein 41